MTGHEDFFDGKVTAEKDTQSEGVTEKDIKTGFGIELMGRIEMQPGKT